MVGARFSTFTTKIQDAAISTRVNKRAIVCLGILGLCGHFGFGQFWSGILATEEKSKTQC